MEYDRFEHHPVLFIWGMLTLILGLLMVGLSIYLLPHILFSWDYAIPLEWFNWTQKLQNNYALLPETAEKWFFMSMLILGLIFLLIAEWIANHLDVHELKMRHMLIEKEIKEPELIQEKKDGWRIFLVVSLILLVTLFGVRLLEWSIQLAPTAN